MVVTTGLREFDAAVQALPAVLAEELRATAATAAARFQGDMQGTMRARGWKLADEVVLEHRASEQRYVVSIRPNNPRPANLPLWLEYGTRHMVARPVHGPAVARLRGAYPQSVDAAIQRAADKTVNR